MVMKKFTLKRELGLFHATVYGVGIILGAGIYVLIGEAAGIAGNSVWISFLLAALIAAFTGLSYAELSSVFPKDAGEYYYALKAFGKKTAFIIGYLVIISGIISVAAVAIGFSGYFSSLFNTNHLFLISLAVILIFSLINFIGIKEAAWLNIILTIIEVGGLLGIIALGFKFIGKVNYFEPALGGAGVFPAAALIFFAFIGFESIIKLSEETKNPTKVIPKALILSIIITTIIYILVAISAISIMGWEKLAASNAPLADVAAVVLGSKAFIVLAIIALFSTANTILIILIATSRLVYGMSKAKCLPGFLSKVHPTTRTPHFAVIGVMIIAILFSILGDVKIVASITNFAVFVTFIIINATVITLRVSKPNLKRKFKVPLNIKNIPVLAIFGILTCGFMLFNLEWKVILVGLGLIILGFILEKAFRRKK
ncbi:MAG: amino acid permease [Nanoarchaeota archaeon]|nr:amino acid permease [Nanoarchaeota archaeon]MBU1622955.1 amino acid permease [Nanoarchaeota archaeon]MBU1974518.1 amino acid permease [Nanoarchaeota archaeon]